MADSISVIGKTLADFPKVHKQWHPTKNEAVIVERNTRSPNYGNVISPGDIAAGSHKKYWWKCLEGPDHEWKAVLGSRTRTDNRGCPFCSGHRYSVTNCFSNLHPNLSVYWHPTKNGQLTPDEITSGTGVRHWWKCPEGPDHEWQDTPRKLIRSNLERGRSGCPYCWGKKASVTNRLDVQYPEVAKQWHPIRNSETTPADVTYGSNKRVWWKCSEGPDHEWQTSVANRTTEGTGCPFCAGQKASVTNSVRTMSTPEVVSQWHPSKNGDMTPDDLPWKSSKRVWWKCSEGPDHEWQQSPHIRNGQETSCPCCANLKFSVTNSLTELYPEIAEQWHPTRNGDLHPESFIAFSTRRIWWKCPVEDDHEWRTTIRKRAIRGQHCPCCAIPIRKIVPSNSLASTHPEALDQWDYDRNEKLPTEVVAGSPTKMYWICPEGHSYRQSLHARAVLNLGCHYCTGLKVFPDGSNSLAAKYPELIEEWDDELNAPITPWEVLPTIHKKIHWKCSKPECGFSWKAVAGSRTTGGTGCPACVTSGFNQGEAASLYLFALRRKSHDGVLFYKLGITNKSVEQRFRRFTRSVISVPRFANCYTTEEEVIEFDSGKDALWLESELKSTEELRYFPNEDFEGKSESFILNPLEFAREEGLLESI